MTDPRRVLIISHAFPPLDRGSVVRVHCFSKYLPQHGWIPTVLTVAPEFGLSKGEANDSMLAEIPDSVRIVRTGIMVPPTNTHSARIEREPAPSLLTRLRRLMVLPERPKKWLEYLIAFPDTLLWWYPKAMEAGLRLIREEGHQAIFATAPPFTNFIIASRLAAKTGLPLILDFRDEWSTNPLFMNGLPGHKRWLSRVVERRLLRQAALTITPTPRSTETLRTSVDGPRERFAMIRNGFDPVHVPETDSNQALHGVLTFAHAGSLSRQRDPRAFLEALDRLVKEDPALRDSFRVVFIGHLDATWRPRLEEWSQRLPIELRAALPAAEFLRWFGEQVDVGLIFQGADEGGARAIPGKLYEYLALRKVVLCLDDPGGETTEFLNEVDLGICAPLRDVDAITAALKRLFANRAEEVRRHQLTREQLAPFNRVDQAGELAAALTRVTEGNRAR